MESDPEYQLITRLIGHGLTDEDWAVQMVHALGHTGEEASNADIAALIQLKEPDAEITAALLRKLKKGSVAHSARQLRKAIEHPTTEWIG